MGENGKGRYWGADLLRPPFQQLRMDAFRLAWRLCRLNAGEARDPSPGRGVERASWEGYLSDRRQKMYRGPCLQKPFAI